MKQAGKGVYAAAGNRSGQKKSAYGSLAKKRSVKSQSGGTSTMRSFANLVSKKAK